MQLEAWQGDILLLASAGGKYLRSRLDFAHTTCSVRGRFSIFYLLNCAGCLLCSIQEIIVCWLVLIYF